MCFECWPSAWFGTQLSFLSPAPAVFLNDSGQGDARVRGSLLPAVQQDTQQERGARAGWEGVFSCSPPPLPGFLALQVEASCGPYHILDLG